VVALDSSRALTRARVAHETPVLAVVADAVAFPLRAQSADLAVAFMSLHDIDDLNGAWSK
jgi:hypothetical protein